MLVVAGESGSGKSAIASIVARTLDISLSELGHAVRERHRDCRSKLNLVDFADHQFKEFGPTTFVAQVARQVPAGVPHILVGPRRPEELAYLDKQGFNTMTVWLDAAPSERMSRRCASLQDVQYFQHRERIESGWGISEIRQLADLHLRNDAGDLHELAKEISKWWICR